MSTSAARTDALKRAMARAAQERNDLRVSFKGEGGLVRFIQHFWKVLEPDRTLETGWALEAMCKHLQAVSEGKITRLLINIPPGSSKSLTANVWWPAWEWSAGGMPGMSYLSFSYSSGLTERDNEKFGHLLSSPEFRKLYPEIELHAKGVQRVSNTNRGWKLASSVSGTATGHRANRVVLDDPHAVMEAESEVVRTKTTRWFKEAMSNRLNDMTKSAIVVIMQRVHADDVSGIILTDKLGYVHLCLQMEYDPAHHCTTYFPRRDIAGNLHATGPGLKQFWTDPRRVEGECFWPELFPPAAVVGAKKLGAHMFAGQYQQNPEPRGGGLFKRDYWRHWKTLQFPKFHFVVASLDGAFTADKKNDPCGFTVWGAFTDENGDACAVSIAAWAKHLVLNGGARPKRKDEKWSEYKLETEAEWGLIQWLNYECKRWGVHKLLVENKANGHDVNTEMLRQFSWAKTVVQLVDPGPNDKTARAHRVLSMFTEGLIFTLDPALNRQWVK